MSIATWIVCGLEIVEYTTITAAKFPFGKKVGQITARLLTESFMTSDEDRTNHGKANTVRPPGISKVVLMM
jgi:hypothetical protein